MADLFTVAVSARTSSGNDFQEIHGVGNREVPVLQRTIFLPAHVRWRQTPIARSCENAKPVEMLAADNKPLLSGHLSHNDSRFPLQKAGSESHKI